MKERTDCVYDVHKCVWSTVCGGEVPLSAVPCTQDKPDAPPLLVSPEGATVKFEDIKFGYSPERTILDGLSFEAPAGKKIALVGGSGSG